jgi:hypothetical protein
MDVSVDTELKFGSIFRAKFYSFGSIDVDRRRPNLANVALKERARPDHLLTTEQVAECLGVAPATIVWWRSQKQGPAWLRLGRGRRSPIRYRPEAVDAYLTSMERASA